MRKVELSIALAILFAAIVATSANPSSAQGYGRDRGHQGYDQRSYSHQGYQQHEHRGPGFGAVIGGVLLGLGLGAVVLSAPQSYAPAPTYYAPAPAYYATVPSYRPILLGYDRNGNAIYQ